MLFENPEHSLDHRLNLDCKLVRLENYDHRLKSDLQETSYQAWIAFSKHDKHTTLMTALLPFTYSHCVLASFVLKLYCHQAVTTPDCLIKFKKLFTDADTKNYNVNQVCDELVCSAKVWFLTRKWPWRSSTQFNKMKCLASQGWDDKVGEHARRIMRLWPHL